MVEQQQQKKKQKTIRNVTIVIKVIGNYLLGNKSLHVSRLWWSVFWAFFFLCECQSLGCFGCWDVQHRLSSASFFLLICISIEEGLRTEQRTKKRIERKHNKVELPCGEMNMMIMMAVKRCSIKNCWHYPGVVYLENDWRLLIVVCHLNYASVDWICRRDAMQAHNKINDTHIRSGDVLVIVIVFLLLLLLRLSKLLLFISFF